MAKDCLGTGLHARISRHLGARRTTAALDAEAEHAVFQRFRELTRDKTSILISHRFPTVRMADRILVIDHGPSRGGGTHDSLVVADGRYAHLFALQAKVTNSGQTSANQRTNGSHDSTKARSLSKVPSHWREMTPSTRRASVSPLGWSFQRFSRPSRALFTSPALASTRRCFGYCLPRNTRALGEPCYRKRSLLTQASEDPEAHLITERGEHGRRALP